MNFPVSSGYPKSYLLRPIVEVKGYETEWLDDCYKLNADEILQLQIIIITMNA